jgi:hypothetical protein
MAIELRKSIKDPELQRAIWGFEVKDDSYWRVLGQDIDNNPNSIYQDVLRSGAIKGSEDYGREAYFAYGAPQGNYLSNYKLRPNQNFIIEATNKFDPNVNPLYRSNAYRANAQTINIYGMDIPSPKEFMEGGGGSRWQSPEVMGRKPDFGTYSTMLPERETRFIDRINPENQRHIRMGTFTSGDAVGNAWESNMKGFKSGPPKIDWRFDYTKPFMQTSPSQHAKNALHIAETVAAQPEVARAVSVAGKGLAVVGAGLEIARVPSRIDNYKLNAWKNDANWKPDFSDELGMAAAAGVETSLNFATLGLWDNKERIARDATSGAGYGKGYYGTMVPPSGTTSVHNNPQSRYERQGVSLDHALSLFR